MKGEEAKLAESTSEDEVKRDYTAWSTLMRSKSLALQKFEAVHMPLGDAITFRP